MRAIARRDTSTSGTRGASHANVFGTEGTTAGCLQAESAYFFGVFAGVFAGVFVGVLLAGAFVAPAAF